MIELPASWRDFDDDDKRGLIEQLKRVELAKQIGGWHPYPWQRPHEHPIERTADGQRKLALCDDSCFELPPVEHFESHEMWLLFGGRGTGKTDGAARYVSEHVRGPACDPRLPGGHRIAIIAPTLGDAVESCVNGPSGLATHYPGCRVWSMAGGTYVRFPNGALAKVFGASTPEDVERLRAGGNRCLAWWEELAAWRHLEKCMEHARYGLRVGPNPHIIASTTPKPRKPIVKLLSDERVHITRGRTQDAVHLDETVRAELLKDYAGTRSGRQELDGELLTDVEGALWTYGIVDAGRVRVDLATLIEQLARIVVAIDPAATNTESSDETGIVAAGRTKRDHCPVCGPVREPHAFVLRDVSGKYDPRQWAAAALSVFDELEADSIIGEVNNGGDMIEETISAAVERANRRPVPYRQVRATRGKRVRAEPISVLYGNLDPTIGPLRASRVHHVGAFPELEDQQTTWTPDDKDSPDRMDALVWALTDLLVKRASGRASVA